MWQPDLPPPSGPARQECLPTTASRPILRLGVRNTISGFVCQERSPGQALLGNRILVSVWPISVPISQDPSSDGRGGTRGRPAPPVRDQHQSLGTRTHSDRRLASVLIWRGWWLSNLFNFLGIARKRFRLLRRRTNPKLPPPDVVETVTTRLTALWGELRWRLETSLVRRQVGSQGRRAVCRRVIRHSLFDKQQRRRRTTSLQSDGDIPILPPIRDNNTRVMAKHCRLPAMVFILYLYSPPTPCL